jgi:hypothetical protein
MRDELRSRAMERFDELPKEQQAMALLAYFAVEGRINASKTFALGESGTLRLRGNVGRGDDSLEARYRTPTSLGDLSVTARVSEGLKKPSYSAGVALHRGADPASSSTGSIALRHDIVGDAQNIERTSLRWERVYKNGTLVYVAAEHTKSDQESSNAAVVGFHVKF